MMRRHITSRFRPHPRIWVVFILGTLIGATGMLVYLGEKLDSFYLERDAMYYANNQKQKEILRLKTELDRLTHEESKRRETAGKIRKIQVEVLTPQRFGQETIKAEVEKLLQPFVGKSIEWLGRNPDLLDTVLQDRTIRLSDPKASAVQLRVKYVTLVDSDLKVWIDARDAHSAE
jgi:hypothetical protein